MQIHHSHNILLNICLCCLSVVCQHPQCLLSSVGLPPQLRGLIAHTTGYRPLHPHSLASATLPTQLLGSPGLGRRVFSPTTAAIVTCAGVLSPALSPHSATILASHTFHRQLGGAGERFVAASSPCCQLLLYQLVCLSVVNVSVCDVSVI